MMLINRLLLKVVAPRPKIERFDKYLFVGPHPDDIEIAAGATVARLTAEGREVYFLICTDGRYGTADPNLQPSQLIEIRRAEQHESARVLGVKEVMFLPFSDGGDYSAEEMRSEIAKVIATICPDVVVTADPKLYTECHPDHIKVGQATAEAYITAGNLHMMREAGINQTATPKALAFFYTGKPNYFVGTGRYYKKMCEAFQCFPSQYDGEEAKTLLLYLNIKSRINGLRRGKTRADAFRVQHNLHLHCCTEAEDK